LLVIDVVSSKKLYFTPIWRDLGLTVTSKIKSIVGLEWHRKKSQNLLAIRGFYVDKLEGFVIVLSV
jgi:hypothetical protein